MLIIQLNYLLAKVLELVINYQLGAILLQNFKIKHVPRKRNIVANTLLRYSKLDRQILLEKTKKDIKKFIKNFIINIEIEVQLL